MGAEPLAGGKTGIEVKTVDDREPEPAGRHGMALRRPVLVERDLHAGDAGPALELFHQRARWMAIAPAVGPEQDHAVAVAPVAIGKIPDSPVIELDQRLDEILAIEVRPLVAQPQMDLDDFSRDGLEVEHAGIVGQQPTDPVAAVQLDLSLAIRMNR